MISLNFRFILSSSSFMHTNHSQNSVNPLFFPSHTISTSHMKQHRRSSNLRKPKKMQSFMTSFVGFLVFLASISYTAAQPLNPGDLPSSNTVPAYPTQTRNQICRLDLSNELFGGVNHACGTTLDRSRCCPVLAAWLFAAHARTALEVSAAAPPPSADLPMMPDDSQNCVNSLQDSLRNRSIRIPQPNGTCDAILCFCGIRLHQITSLSCPNAFNITAARNVSATHNATPTAVVRNLEKNCRNASYAGCTQCLSALQKVTRFSSSPVIKIKKSPHNVTLNFFHLNSN